MRSKKYLEKAKKINSLEAIEITKAIEAVKDSSISKFKGSIELKINTNINPKETDQVIRFTTEIPNPESKEIEVIAITDEKIESIKGKIKLQTGTEDLIEDIFKGKVKLDKIDAIITEPKYMPKIAKAARILGPKGLMPSPKNGRIGEIKNILAELQKGKIEIRTQLSGTTIHTTLGKESTDTSKLVENYNKIIEEVLAKKPIKMKGDLIKSIFVCTSMSPSQKVIVN